MARNARGGRHGRRGGRDFGGDGNRVDGLHAADVRLALLERGVLVAITGHLGGLLVWGADFLRP